MTTHPTHHPTHSSNPEPDPDRSADTGVDAGTGVADAASDRDDGRPLVDLIAGDPPVPITVWRTARAGGDQDASIPARLARRLVAAYSRPGEAVVDLTDDHALITACWAGDRRHHRAWFTDVASLIIGPATVDGDDDGDGSGSGDGEEAGDDADTDRLPLHRGARPGRAVRTVPDRDSGPDSGPDTDDAETVRSLADWFGDDLTDPQLPPAAAPVVPVPDGTSLAGLTSLVVATWPLDPDPAAGRVRLAWLLTACRDLLRPGGCLVLIVALPPGHAAAGHGVTPEDFSPIVDAAARTGLGYLQHIVAVAADISGEHGDAFVYHLTDDEELLSLSRARAQDEGHAWTVAHVRVHADLLVFTPVQATPPRGRRGGGQTRPDTSLEGGGRRG